MAQITLNSSGVASSGSLLLQTNGTTTQATVDTSGNLGLGVTPSASWSTNYKAQQIGASGAVWSHGTGVSECHFSTNAYFSGAGYKYLNTGYATEYYQYNGAHYWQIAASGSANAAITFTQAMTLDASGNLGIGTTSPSYKLTVQDTGNSYIVLQSGTAGYANLRFIVTSAAGIVGTEGAFPLVFRTSDAERARIDSSGNLLVGTTTKGAISGYGNNAFTSSVADGGGAGALVAYSTGVDNSNAFLAIKSTSTTSSSQRFIQFYANAGATGMGGIVGNGAGNVQFATLSDAREKTNIQLIAGSLDKIKLLKPSSFDWISDGSHVKAGFIAQEVQQVFPEFVVENVAKEGDEPRLGLTGGMTGGIIAHLVAAIQEQQAIITQLQADVAALKGQA